MKDPFVTPPHATPIEDISDLKLTGITTYAALCNQEAENILVAKGKYFSEGPKKRIKVSERFLKKVHKDMFGSIWSWAGRYRKSQTNIGIKPYLISVELIKLCDDIKYWEEENWNFLEVGAQIHHRLASIHPFENGNGRHARFISDLYLHSNGHLIPKWPIDLSNDAPGRTKYIEALQAGDKGDIHPLISYMENYL